MPVRIRRAEAGDIPAIAEIHALSWRDAYRGTLADEFLDRRVRGELLGQW